jgi:MFS family permease
MGGFLNICGNLSGIVSPIVIGVILERTENFQYAMWYIAGVAGLGLLAYIFLVGKIEVIVPEKRIPTPWIRMPLIRRLPTNNEIIMKMKK